MLTHPSLNVLATGGLLMEAPPPAGSDSSAAAVTVEGAAVAVEGAVVTVEGAAACRLCVLVDFLSNLFGCEEVRDTNTMHLTVSGVCVDSPVTWFPHTLFPIGFWKRVVELALICAHCFKGPSMIYVTRVFVIFTALPLCNVS